MYKVGKIVDKKKDKDGVLITVKLPLEDLQLLNRNGEDCGLWLNDNRLITVEQRKKIYALIKDIADFLGYSPDESKQCMKYEFIIRKGREEFSLSNCSLAEASEFLDFLIDFCMKNNIPLSDFGLNRTSDINKFLYICLKNKKCCVCGNPADMHHEDAIGMGSDRRHYDDTNNRKMALCRTHHTERHTIGEEAFFHKYHVYGIKFDRSC